MIVFKGTKRFKQQVLLLARGATGLTDPNQSTVAVCAKDRPLGVVAPTCIVGMLPIVELLPVIKDRLLAQVTAKAIAVKYS